jgi:DNA-binding CsgD family transcriptional regulator
VQRLGHADLEGVVRVAGELAEPGDGADAPFPEPLLESLRALLRSDSAAFSELDRIRCRVLGGGSVGEDPGDDPGEEVFWALRHQWPTCAYEDRTLDFGAHALSDFVTRRELHRLQIYSDLFRPWRLEHEISVGLPAELTHTKLFLFINGPARRDFGGRERTILTLLRPHLVERYESFQLRRRAAAALGALDRTDEPLVLLDDHGRPEFATARARRLLAQYGLSGDHLPARGPLRAHTVRPGVLLLEERRPFRLTPREREILALVAEGRTNAEIAAVLWISPLTVGKHLENTYAKLGVATRTAAISKIREQDGRRLLE